MAPIANQPVVAPTPASKTQSSIVAKGNAMDSISDMVDQVNVYLGTHPEAPRPESAHDRAWRREGSRFDSEKDKAEFRRFEEAVDHVKAFYKIQHKNQTVEFNIAAREKFIKNRNASMTVWEAMDKLDTLIDQSDPDTSLSQTQHALQTAEAMRRDAKPDWMQVTGLIHDLGKLLCFFGADGQWDIVGDTFVVGCAPEGTVYPATFEANPDFHDPRYNTKYGMYEPNCGLQNVMLSFGHDEYLYSVVKRESTLPQAALDMIRYHSFYPWHREGAYRHLCAPEDEEALANVLAFNPYDLYSKSDDPLNPEELKPYYESLIAKYFGGKDRKIQW
ncbi:probable myo-inositol oxygenase [Melanopsichium pennsylvanicum]|uniref:Inositol oxygenase n=2 Tax=Melanopsichium pennsylvanicum TaxID=63383 RepID=A0AAJ4XFD5_9BASI|nr:probable myo-inositol oxygenase [Melanopsichium pennsylvanicum 4]SNX81337.1 probable myo-inositol oxygenase [Melanopsichium pennsylvanicum]